MQGIGEPINVLANCNQPPVPTVGDSKLGELLLP